MKQFVLAVLLAVPLFCGARIRPVAITGGQPIVLAPDTSANKPTASASLKLPPHTVGLVYMISTYGGSDPRVVTRPLNLLAQVDQQLSKSPDRDMMTITRNLVPSSTAAFINVYLFPGVEEGAAVNSFCTGNYLTDYNRFHYNGGATLVPLLSSTKSVSMLLKIENVSTAQTIKVVIEAVAFVDDGL